MGKELGRKLRGISHLALNSSDMARTAKFYEMLGIPLVKTMDMPQYGFQHFFFDIGNGDCLAYFWYTDDAARPAELNEELMDGAMNHVAFEIDWDDIQGFHDLLVENEIPFGFVNHTTTDAKPTDPTAPDVFNDLSVLGPDTFAASFYFQGPDGEQLEFCAWGPAWERFEVDHEGRSSTLATRSVPRVPYMTANTLPGAEVGATN